MTSLIKEAITFYKKNRDVIFKLYISFFPIFLVLNFVIQKISLKINEPLLGSVQDAATADSFQNLLSADFIQVTRKYLPILLLLTVLFSFLKYFFNCLIISSIAKNDNQITEKPHLPSIFAIFTTFLLVKLMCFFGFLLFIIPGIIFSVFLLMVPCILVMENKTGFTSLDRSFHFMKKDMMNIIKNIFSIWIKYLCVVFIASICISLLQTVLYAIMKHFSSNTLLTIVDNIFIFINSYVDTVLYMILSILLQNVFYIYYKRNSDVIQETEQYKERKYSLEDYYREKETSTDDDNDSDAL